VDDRPGRRLESTELVVVDEIVYLVTLGPTVPLAVHLRLHLARSRLTHWALISLLPMRDPSRRELPRQVWYELDEALALLAEQPRIAQVARSRVALAVGAPQPGVGFSGSPAGLWMAASTAASPSRTPSVTFASTRSSLRAGR
jgi:hypothetical protein